MNMFKPVQAKSAKEYFAMVPEERRELMEFLDKFIQDAAPSLQPNFLYNMLGYGSFPYKNAKKEIIQWPTIGLASQKNYISVYVCAVTEEGYIAEKYKKELGKVKVGRSCISFKKLTDVHLPTLEKVLKEAEKHPGFMLVKK